MNSIISLIQGLSFIVGLATAILLMVFPRFGPGSWQLALFLFPACISGAVEVFDLGFTQDFALRLSLSLLVLASLGGYVAGSTIDQDDYRQVLRNKRSSLVLIGIASAILIPLLFILRSTVNDIELPEGFVALGPAGYASAILLVMVSVLTLAGFEQILRSAQESVRWEIKFLLLGLGASFAAIIYLASKILLYSPSLAIFSYDSLVLFHLIFLLSCGLIAISWKRSSGRTRVAVSQGIIYSSITLLCVGVYLITSSLIARWASSWGDIGLPTEALVFLLSSIALLAVLLATAFRHRVRTWIRRNFYSGRYDYRLYWLEANERIRSIDSPQAAAKALADIVQKALGAIDITVWIRYWNPNRARLVAVLGTIQEKPGAEAAGIVELLVNISGPVSAKDIESIPEMLGAGDFLQRTHASLLVPLISSDRIVGILTVGSDRSGRPYDWEAREFLHVLAGHAAGELHKTELLATLVEAKEDEAFRAFSTFVLHDLKNFASTLSLIAQNSTRYQDNPEFQKDAFHSVFDTAEKMKRLCNSLRTFSGAQALNKKLEDLNRVASNVAKSLEAGLDGHLTLELNDVPPVLIDAEEISRVLQNILLNAREAIPEAGSISLKTVCRPEAVEVIVEDNGRGMAREFLERELFLPFRTTKSNGLGIGLFQSKKIMEAHQGSIIVESEEGKGTKVRLIFPAPQGSL
jgi:putative PEP-CTERM system histidine kinase